MKQPRRSPPPPKHAEPRPLWELVQELLMVMWSRLSPKDQQELLPLVERVVAEFKAQTSIDLKEDKP
jgi:hypothetical protein